MVQQVKDKALIQVAGAQPAIWADKVIITSNSRMPNNVRLSFVESVGDAIAPRAAVVIPLEEIPSILEELNNVARFLREKKTGIVQAPAAALELLKDPGRK